MQPGLLKQRQEFSFNGKKQIKNYYIDSYVDPDPNEFATSGF